MSEVSGSLLGRMRRLSLSETQRFLLLSILIGVFAGLVVTCFHISMDWLSWAALGTPSGSNRWATVLVPTLGALASGLLVIRLFPAARGSGVNYTKTAIYISDGRIPFSGVIGKFVACTLSIGSGNPLGPEDPALQMGAGTASTLGRAFRLGREQMRMIAPVGAAAGIGAAFNTPITAVLFVIEEVLAGWNAGVLGSIVLSAVAAVVVVRAFLGDEPLFHVPTFTLTHPSELIVYAGIGLVAGLLGALYLRLMLRLRTHALRAPAWGRPLRLAGAGALVGVTGLFMPQILGSGYPAIDSALHDEFVWPMLLGLGLVRVVLTSFCFASGVPGGLFAPTLFIGAMIGGGLGGLAHEFWPFPTSPASAYVLVGMGSFFAAVFRTPMTSMFMVFEVTTTYVIILPVMIANTLAHLVSHSLHRHSLFDEVGRQDGTHLPSIDAQREQMMLRVEEAMWPVDRAAVAQPGTSIGTLREMMQQARLPAALLAQAEGWRIVGAAAIASDGYDPAAPATTLPAAPANVTHPDESADAALRLLAAQSVVPVVSRHNTRQLLGVLTVESILSAYGMRQPGELPPASPPPPDDTPPIVAGSDRAAEPPPVPGPTTL
jgi:chloride channel protein, CIC family